MEEKGDKRERANRWTSLRPQLSLDQANDDDDDDDDDDDVSKAMLSFFDRPVELCLSMAMRGRKGIVLESHFVSHATRTHKHTHTHAHTHTWPPCD